jgi:hypothetical protein
VYQRIDVAELDAMADTNPYRVSWAAGRAAEHTLLPLLF